MKKVFLLLFILYYPLFTVYCSAQTYSWAAVDTSYSSSHGICLSKDLLGNLVVAERGSSGLSILKYDTKHNVIWKKMLGATFNIASGNSPVGLCTDISGNVYLTSNFYGNLLIDSISYGFPYGGNSMLLIKFDPDGRVQWMKQSKTIDGASAGMRVSTDVQNNIYVGGFVNGEAYFDSIFVKTPWVVYNYIAKYNTNGKLLWLKHGSINSFSGWGIGMKTDTAGNTYLAGTFNRTVKFDSLSLTSYGPDGYQDVYIAKIDSSGNWIWAIHAGGIYQDALYNLDMDGEGNIYITGFLGSPTATFGNLPPLTNASGDDFFIAKYDASGNALWAVNGWKNGYSNTFCADKEGNTYVSISSKFLRKYDNTGKHLWSQTKNAANIDMLADNAGNIYITGYFQNSVSFDNFTLTSKQPNTNQMFIAQLYDPPGTISISEREHYNTSMYISPNPASGSFTIDCAFPKPQDTYTLKINNTLGQTIYSETIKEHSASFSKQIDLGPIPRGMYFVELCASSGACSPEETIREVKKLVLH